LALVARTDRGQIAARLRRMHPDDPSQRVSHDTIHAAIYAQPRGGLKAPMVEALRQAKPARGARRTSLAGSAMVPEALRIIHSPDDVEARLIPSHWEGDLIKGGGKPGGGGGKPGSNSQGQPRRRPQQGGGGRSRKAA
jgi:IS30 family transposase